MSKQSKVSVTNTTTELLMPPAIPSNLTELQAAYGASCSLYEHKANKKLQQSDTIIVSGFGCSLRVKNGALEIFPGKTHAAQTQGTEMLYRGVHRVTSIILLSNNGIISLDAIKYCREQGIAIAIIDGSGNLVQSLTSESLSNAALRRKQYLAHENGKAGYVVSALVRCKIEGQLATLERHCELPGKRTEAIETIKTGLQWFDLFPLPPYLTDINYLRTYEGRIAAFYFSTWHGLRIQWGKADIKTAPPHWTQVTERNSPLQRCAKRLSL